MRGNPVNYTDPSGLCVFNDLTCRAIIDQIVQSHSRRNDGFIIGLGGGLSSLQFIPAFTLLVPPHFLDFDECRLPHGGLVTGVEVVYDFKHLERGLFFYSGTSLNIGTFLNVGGVGYVGQTRGFANASYEDGVGAYRGYFASGTLNVGFPGTKVGGAVIEAAPLDDDKRLNPTGVFATYYGIGGGLSAGSPVNVDLAVTHYSLIHREQYLFFGLGSVDKKKKDAGYRRTVAALITGELMTMSTSNPLIRPFTPQALTDLWSFANDTSD